MPKGRFWNSKEIQIVEEMRLEGCTCPEIATRLNRSAVAIMNLVSRLKMSPRFCKARYRWLQLFLQCETNKEVASMSGKSLETVRQTRYRLKKSEAL